MLTKNWTFICRCAFLALSAAALCAAPARGDGHFPTPRFSSQEIQEFEGLCETAGHEAIARSQQGFGSEQCPYSIKACRFSPDANPSQGGATGCVFAWDTYYPAKSSYRFGFLYSGQGCLLQNEIAGEETVWDVCVKTIPACEKPRVRMLDGKETDNPFAPCVEIAGTIVDPSLNEQNRAGRTPLHLAIFQGRYNDIQLMLERGADPNIQDRRGETPLHYAAAAAPSAAGRLTRLLLAAGASPNIQSRSGETALHVAAGRSPHAVRLLLDNGADPRITDRRGRTSLQIAESRGQTQAAEMLRAAVQ